MDDKKRMIDPPSGWKYGFPKAVPVEVENGEVSMEDWLLELAMKYGRM